jgi:hypothetical protein
MNWEDSVGPRSLPPIDESDLFDAIARTFIPRDFGQDDRVFGSRYSRIVRQRADRVMNEVFESRPEQFENWEGVLYWTIETFLALREELDELARETPGFRFAAVGFLDPKYEPNAFGVALFSSQPAGAYQQAETRYLRIPGRLFRRRGEAEIRTPIVIRPCLVTQHALPTHHMALGTAACWAKSRIHSSTPIGPGVLTAEHVAGAIIGAPVSFGTHHGKVLDVAPSGGIDAAVVSSPEPYNGTQRLQTKRLVAPWTDVQFSGMMTKQPPVQTKVTMTTDMLGILNSPRFPVKLILAGHGQSGDSGALVRELNGFNVGDGVGIYTDLFTNVAGQTGGIAQHLHQVVEVMDMELYE